MPQPSLVTVAKFSPGVDPDEEKYAAVRASLDSAEEKYEHGHKVRIAAKLHEHANEMRDCEKKLREFENTYGTVATSLREQYRFPKRILDVPLRLGVQPDAVWRHEQLMKMAESCRPPPPPDVSYTPFWVHAMNENPGDVAFVYAHSQKVTAFLNGTEEWVRLFFKDMALLRDVTLTPSDLDTVRNLFVETFKWHGFARASLPSAERFMFMYRTMYPK